MGSGFTSRIKVSYVAINTGVLDGYFDIDSKYDENTPDLDSTTSLSIDDDAGPKIQVFGYTPSPQTFGPANGQKLILFLLGYTVADSEEEMELIALCNPTSSTL